MWEVHGPAARPLMHRLKSNVFYGKQIVDLQETSGREKDMGIEDKLQLLREQMQKRGLAAYIVPTEDFHNSEYVGDYFKAREYLSGFTGSAGTLLVCMESAALWTDGRYFLQAGQQLAGSPIELMKSGQPGVPSLSEYLAGHLETGDKVGFDGRTVTRAFVEELRKKMAKKQIIYCGGEDLVDLVWPDRPPLSAEPVWELAEEYAGLSREEKLARVRQKMQEEKTDALLMTALDEIAWLLNLRGNDVCNTPVFLAYMLLLEKKAVLCVQEKILSQEIKDKLKRADVTILPYEEIEKQVGSLQAGQRLWADGRRVNYQLLNTIPAGVEQLDQPGPAALMKAVKTPEEMAHLRAAHVKDGVAVTRFIRFLKTRVGREEITEMSAAGVLEGFRKEMEGYLGSSFAPIIAYGPHGAIVHYEAVPDTDAQIQPRGLCLADTGGHYEEGTTDITRTIALGELTAEEKRAYTLVLKGHLRLGAAKFLQGVCGQNLDCLARQPLWENGLDYNHGTGHGVGYLLSVHEGPQNFRWRISKDTDCVPLEEGMVISNEPGLYVTDKFGIRHENLVLCRKGEQNEYGQFMYLEPLTMVPFDRDAIEASLLNEQEKAWLNAYHTKVYERLSPYLEEEEQKWLQAATMAVE